MSSDPPAPSRVLCLGEPLVDLICERPLERVCDADAFVPRFGGAVANVAVLAARVGAHVALAGAGEDEWGYWLRDRLKAEGVDLSLFELVAGSQTRVATVAVAADGEARYEVYGETVATVAHALASRLEDAVRASGAVFLCTNTLVDDEEREVSMRARELALELDRPVIFDPNLRLRRWRSRAQAAATANACVPGALLVRTNEPEAA